MAQVVVKNLTALNALSMLDASAPGRGWDDYLSADADHAMAYALYASTAVATGEFVLASKGIDWLVHNASPLPKVTGWGLPFAWDAFSDGSINPIETVYGITTALGIRALVDGHIAHRPTAPSDLLPIAVRALEHYSKAYTNTPNGGFFWYSDQVQDAKNVANVNSMLIGQYARAGKLAKLPWLIDLAEKTARELTANQKSTELGTFWTYSTENSRPNDLVHACYTVQGLIDMHQALGTPYPDLGDHIKYLKSFVREGAIFEFAPHPELRSILVTRPARLWGIGSLVHIMATTGETQFAQELLPLIAPYVMNDGRYASTPGGDICAPRMVTHLAWGLSALEAAQKERSIMFRIRSIFRRVWNVC